MSNDCVVCMSSAENGERNVGTRIYLFEHSNINRVHQFKEQVNYFMAVHLHITCFAMDVCSCRCVLYTTHIAEYTLFYMRSLFIAIALNKHWTTKQASKLTLHRHFYDESAQAKGNRPSRTQNLSEWNGEMEAQESHTHSIDVDWYACGLISHKFCQKILRLRDLYRWK